MTAKIALENKKPLTVVQLDQNYLVGAVIDWLNENRITVLNVAGLRELKVPGIYEQAKRFLLRVLFGPTTGC